MAQGSETEIKLRLNRHRTNSAPYISTECSNTNAVRQLFRKRGNRAAWRHGRTVSYTVGCQCGRWERFGFAGCNKRLLPSVLVDAVLIEARQKARFSRPKKFRIRRFRSATNAAKPRREICRKD